MQDSSQLIGHESNIYLNWKHLIEKDNRRNDIHLTFHICGGANLDLYNTT